MDKRDSRDKALPRFPNDFRKLDLDQIERALSSSKNLLLIIAADRSIRYTNATFRDMVGRPEDEMVGRDFLDLTLDEQLRSTIVAEFERVMREGRSENYETPLQLRPGDIRHILWNSTVIKMVDGTPLCVLFGQDITGRKQTERALRKSEERFRSIFENAMVGMYRTTPDGLILMANPALVRMLGYSSLEELANRNLESEGFDHGHPRSLFKELMERDGVVVGYESVWLRHDGSTVFVRESARAFRGEAGHVLYYEGTVEDITDRKLAESALRESEERYRSTINALNDIVHVVDRDLRVVLCNEAMRRVSRDFGFPDDPIGHEIMEICRIVPDEVREQYNRVLQTAATLVTEEMTKTEAGEIWTETRKIPILDEGGQVQRIITIIRDISERKRVEQWSMAAAKFEGLEILAGGLSRRLAELMSVILGHSAVAKSILPTGDPVYQNLAALEEAGRHVMRMADQLKYVAADVQPRPRPVDLVQLLEEILPELSRTIDPQWLIELAIDHIPVIAKVDPGMLEQALIALLINARQAAPDAASAKVRVDLVKFDEPIRDRDYAAPAGTYALVEIIDKGPGISPQSLDGLFVPFGQGYGERTHGLGLSIVHGILKAHAGFARIGEGEGGGATVAMYLPVPETTEVHREHMLAGGVTYTILLVHNEPHVSGMFRSVLIRAGYSVLSAADSRHASVVFSQQSPIIDLVLFNIDLPKEAAAEAEDALRNILRIKPDVKIAALSNDPNAERAGIPSKIGIKLILPHSIGADDLLFAVDRALGAEP